MKNWYPYEVFHTSCMWQQFMKVYYDFASHISCLEITANTCKHRLITMLKAYKFRLNPTEEQKTQFEKHIGSCRYVYNWALAEKIKTYAQKNKSISSLT